MKDEARRVAVKIAKCYSPGNSPPMILAHSSAI
jgi:hypothetical protein